MIDIFYLLLPRHSGLEAHQEQDEIHEFIATGTLDRMIRARNFLMKSQINWKGMLFMGESAGAHWASYAWLKQRLDIKVEYIMCGLLTPYVRKSSHDYRGETFEPKELRTIGLKLLKDAAWARPGYYPKDHGRWPPGGMANLPLTAVRVPARCNMGPVRWETLWSLLWSHPTTLHYAKAMFEAWLNQDSKRAQLTKDVLRLIEPNRRTKAQIWLVDVLEGRFKFCEDPAEDISDIVKLEASDVAEALGLDGLQNLGITYLPEQRALSYTVPPVSIAAQPRSPDWYIWHDERDPTVSITVPLECPTWFFVHDEHDPYVPIKDVEIFSYILQLMYGEKVVHWNKVTDSQPLHGFDDYDGSQDTVQQILDVLGWTQRDMKS